MYKEQLIDRLNDSPTLRSQFLGMLIEMREEIEYYTKSDRTSEELYNTLSHIYTISQLPAQWLNCQDKDNA